jgi:hypothetical protein
LIFGAALEACFGMDSTDYENAWVRVAGCTIVVLLLILYDTVQQLPQQTF